MKVAITDYSFPNLDVERGILEPLGCTVVAGQCKTPEALIELTADADYVITQFAPMDAAVVSKLQKARVIVRYGIGFDNVDIDVAKAKNLPVCNVPAYCIDEVADHTAAFILGATRRLVENDNVIKDGDWKLAVSLEAMRCLRDQTVGILGFGRIGREVVARLRGFKCKILVFDPVVPADDITSAGCDAVSLDDLFTASDILTLHCPSNAQTRGVINSESLSKMKAGAILINVGRGDLVDTAALVEALQSGQLSAASLDVFAPEPLAVDNPLRSMDNVITSSHIASCSVVAARSLRESAANIVADVIRGNPLTSIVNGVASPEG